MKTRDCWAKLALVDSDGWALDKRKLQRVGMFELQTLRCHESPCGQYGIGEKTPWRGWEKEDHWDVLASVQSICD